MEFGNAKEAARALKNLNESELGGRMIRLDNANPRGGGGERGGGRGGGTPRGGRGGWGERVCVCLCVYVFVSNVVSSIS